MKEAFENGNQVKEHLVSHGLNLESVEEWDKNYWLATYIDGSQEFYLRDLYTSLRIPEDVEFVFCNNHIKFIYKDSMVELVSLNLEDRTGKIEDNFSVVDFSEINKGERKTFSHKDTEEFCSEDDILSDVHECDEPGIVILAESKKHLLENILYFRGMSMGSNFLYEFIKEKKRKYSIADSYSLNMEPIERIVIIQNEFHFEFECENGMSLFAKIDDGFVNIIEDIS